jgi:hypothetical protein
LPAFEIRPAPATLGLDFVLLSFQLAWVLLWPDHPPRRSMPIQPPAKAAAGKSNAESAFPASAKWWPKLPALTLPERQDTYNGNASARLVCASGTGLVIVVAQAQNDLKGLWSVIRSPYA